MKIHVGFDLTYQSAHATPMVFMLNVHPSRAPDLVTPDRLRITPARTIMPTSTDSEQVRAGAGAARPNPHRLRYHRRRQRQARSRQPLGRAACRADLPHDALVYLLASRYCETDLMMNKAWELFGATPPGWRRVQAICDFVHGISSSTTRTPTRPAAPRAVSPSSAACAATSRISPSRSAAA